MTYVQSVATDELGRPSSTNIASLATAAFDSELREFKEHPTPRRGADLFERAFVAELPNVAAELATYVASNASLSSTIKNLALRFIKPEHATVEFDAAVSITRHRAALRDNPRNPIRWAELARSYLIKHDLTRATRAIRTAFQLCPKDRYVFRSAVRYFIHIGDFDQLLSIVGMDVRNINDPWLKGVGISSLLLAGKAPKRKITPDPKLIKPSALFESSEFLAACGMLEIFYGKKGQARQLLRSAWADPSCNVTTHAEWATRALFPGLRDELSNFGIQSPEAAARIAFSCGKWERVYEATTDWMLQEPFSRRPLRFLARVENVRTRFEEALQYIARAEANGDTEDSISISKIYALLCLGRLQLAANELLKLPVPDKLSSMRCVLIANWGLLAMLAGEKSRGIELYGRAEREGGMISRGLKDAVFVNAMVAKRLAGIDAGDDELTRLKRIVDESQSDIDYVTLGKRATSAGKIETTGWNEKWSIPKPALRDCEAAQADASAGA